MRTFDELRDNLASTIRDTQITTLLGEFINLTVAQIHNEHAWTWLRRKTTFATVTDQEDYNLDEEIDRLVLVRQIETPTKLIYLPDQHFYRALPDPENQSSGVPKYYRLWEETGFSTNLSAADTLYVVSSSASDGSTFKVVVVGRNSSGEEVTEEITLNGTTNVTSTTTWAAAGLKQVSKSARTTGTISVYRTTGATLLSELAPSELAPRFKRLSLYPVPSSAVTMYVEYFERLRLLVNDADTPQMDYKWMWVLRSGALAKAWAYKQNEQASAIAEAVFQDGLKKMKAQDMANYDYIPVLQPRQVVVSNVHRYTDSINNSLPVYGVGA